MARTLQQLKESIENLISQQGEDAPVAAFIFTQEDVFEMDEECNPTPYPLEIAEVVLDEIKGYDYIYSQIFECIDDEVKRLQVENILSNQSPSE